MKGLLSRIGAVLWRVWKWVVHLFTGSCEVYRLCFLNTGIEDKTQRIEQCLRSSRCKRLNTVVTDTKLTVDQSLEIIVKEKHINTTKHPEFVQAVCPVLERVRGVRLLLSEVEGLRKQPYSQDDQTHEDMLRELWTLLNPGVELEKRITKQWQDIGFQGDNPATDFRGMGVLSLYCLRFFSSHYSDLARSSLSHSHHPSYGFPFALVGINLTSLLYTWLEGGKMNTYLYTTCSQWPLQLEDFYEMFSYLFVEFDKFWMDRKPENVMSFPVVREEFAAIMEQQLLVSPSRDLVMNL